MTRASRLRRPAALLVPLALALAACGGGDGDDSGDDAADAPSEESADDAADGSADDASGGDSGDPGDGGDAGDGGDSGDDGGDSGDDGGDAGEMSGDAGSDYCNLARTFQEENDELEMAGAFEPDSLQEAFDTASELIGQISGIAPDEIRDDYATLGEGIDQFRAELEAVDYNMFALDPEQLDPLTQGMDEASSRIEQYNSEVCGIEPAVGGDLGGADDGDAGDTGDLGDMGFDPEDFGMDPEQMEQLGEAMMPMITQQFVAEGYSPEEAECLAEAIFSMDFGAAGDPEEFVDPFTACGVEP